MIGAGAGAIITAGEAFSSSSLPSFEPILALPYTGDLWRTPPTHSSLSSQRNQPPLSEELPFLLRLSASRRVGISNGIRATHLSISSKPVDRSSSRSVCGSLRARGWLCAGRLWLREAACSSDILRFSWASRSTPSFDSVRGPSLSRGSPWACSCTSIGPPLLLHPIILPSLIPLSFASSLLIKNNLFSGPFLSFSVFFNYSPFTC